ncbi:hypothetical protein VPH35_010170 [Triticum aestivum]
MAGGQVAMHGAFQLCNYLLLAMASGCISLALPLRLVPSLCCSLLVFLHALTVVFAMAGCSGSFTTTAGTWASNVHTTGVVLTAIIQFAMVLLAFTRTAEFLAKLRTNVPKKDRSTSPQSCGPTSGRRTARLLVGGLSASIFMLKWVSLVLDLVLQLGDHGDEEAVEEYAKTLPSG